MKNVCITGANRGIGLALAQLYSQDHHVYALCRHSSDELDTLPNTQIITGIDVNDPHSRQKAIDQLQNIDILLLSAGILERDMDDLAQHEASVLAQIQTNAISPLIFAKMAQPILAQGAKIMLMTSRMGSMADNHSGGLDGYRMSKAALNAAGCNLAHLYKPHGIGVYIIHPGHIQTDMTNHTGNITADEVAAQIVERLASFSMEQTGEFWHANGEPLPW